MLLVGGEGSALLLGFALVAAMGLRRRLANEGRRLLQRGARRSQVWLSATARSPLRRLPAHWPVRLAGWASSRSSPVGRASCRCGARTLGRHRAGLGVVLPPGSPRRRPCSPARLLAGRRSSSARSAARRRCRRCRGSRCARACPGRARRPDPFVGRQPNAALALPLLVSFVAAVVAVRLLRPLTRLGERAAAPRPARVRLALLALSRAPVRTTATAAFLLLSALRARLFVCDLSRPSPG